MSSVNKQEILIVSQFMTDLWSYIKGHWKDDDTTDYWNSVIDDACKIVTKYQAIVKQAGGDANTIEQMRFIYWMTVSACNGLEKKNVKKKKGEQ